MQLVVWVLAAYGLVCAFWTVFGLWFSGARGWAAVCFSGPGQTAAIGRCRWLRSWGLFRGPIFLVQQNASQDTPELSSRERENIEICTLAALSARLELELENFAGTGYADITGNRSGGSISKL